MRYLQPAFLLILFFISIRAYPQCSTIRQQRDITFNTDKDCAPVSVTDFTITYFFNVPQDPADIVIRFDWNDPGNNVDEYGLGDAGFIVNGTNTEFTATGTFMYPENDECVFLPVSSVIVNGESCETSRQTQVVTSWARDNEFGGNIAINPGLFDVCYGNAVNNAVFEDNSTFNCNINVEPDNPNRQARYTQFVYGTNHNAGNSIRNLALVDGDGNTINLTDNNADLSSTQTINGVTGTYFGNIIEIPFPADGPQLTSFPISAPADANNAIGSAFEITLYNWNICNPFNGDYANPNYEDAVATTAYITIVDPPVPDFQTRLGNVSGAVKNVFCLGETIYFDNLSTDASDYTWEFYDDDLGNSLLNTSTANNPSFAFNTPGNKLIRLYARNAGAQGACEVLTEKIITLSPAAVANIGLFDPTFTTAIAPEFCVDDGSSTVTIGFRDETINIEPQTEWRWEFYDEEGNLSESIPAGNNTFGSSVTDFTRNYSSNGEYLVRLIARDNASECESVAEEMIYLYDIPEVSFLSTEVCAGDRTAFTDIPDASAALNTQVNGDQVVLYEWDFSYDGMVFNPEVTFTDNDDFAFYVDGNDLVGGAEPSTSEAGSYTVALRMTTDIGECSAIHSRQVEVHPLPNPVLSSDYSQPLCPGESVHFMNLSDLNEGDYQLVITDNVHVTDTLDLNQSDTVYTFDNHTASSKTYYAKLTGVTAEGCYAESSLLTVEVLPSAPSDFSDINYSIISGNCSIWESTLVVSNATQSLNPDSYIWTIADEQGVLPGYPVTKEAGAVDFHRLDYTLTNESGQNKVYTVSLEVLKSDVCISGSQHSYVINPIPSSTFELEEVDECTYKTIRLEANQKGLADYYWDIQPQPDQRLNENETQTLIYLRPSPDSADITVNISLITENMVGCQSDTTWSNFLLEALEEPLMAHFDMDKDTLVLPENEVHFTNNSSAYSGVTYWWDFGDGMTSSGADPGLHTYTEPGIYEISLTVSNAFCGEDYSRSVVVEPADPIIDFSADNLEGCAPLTVNFTNESSYAEPGTFFWDFGDGKTSPADDPSHTYSRAGIYTVTLYGENRKGSGNVAIKENYIEVFEQPIANFALTPSVVYVPGNPVYFKNSSNGATAYFWDFGDGNTSEQQDPIHHYEREGSYDVTLAVSTSDGCADTLHVPAAVRGIVGGDIKAPNAFSPSKSGPGSSNGSGETINDVFIPRVESVTEFRMLIYNKWGQLLFESRRQDIGWDGYFNGILQPSDVYVYKLELTYADGRQAVKVGDVTLVR